MKHVQTLFIPVFSIIVLVGAALYSLTVPIVDPVLETFAGGRVSVEGVVVRDLDIRDTTIRLTVKPRFINGKEIEGSKNIIVVANRFTNVSYGDRIRAEGNLKAPQSFETDTGRVFNYPNYLWAHGVSHTISFADVEVLEEGEGNRIVSFLLGIKHALIRGIEASLPEPYAALGEGLLLGEKQSLGDRLYDAFVRSGVVHIIVLSGYNVALVINSVLYIALRVLPRLAGYALAAFFVIGFAILTGGSETTIRATIMALLMMVARVLNRPAAALRGLLIAAAAMALYNPFLVLYDLSFQLSVLATFGLIVFSDPIAKRMKFIPEKFGFREIIATTLATQITVLPLLIFSIGAVSLVFLPANALVLPAVPIAMLLSFIAALVALVLLPTLSTIVAFPAYAVLAYIISVSEFFGTLPFAQLKIPPNAMWMVLVLIFSIYLFFGVRFLKKRIFLK